MDTNFVEPFLWRFGGVHRHREMRVDGRLRFSSAHACLAAARRGLGIVRTPAFVAADDVRAGRLCPVLEAFEPEALPIYAVFPNARHLAAGVRIFIDFLADRFSGEPSWHAAMGTTITHASGKSP